MKQKQVGFSDDIQSLTFESGVNSIYAVGKNGKIKDSVLTLESNLDMGGLHTYRKYNTLYKSLVMTTLQTEIKRYYLVLLPSGRIVFTNSKYKENKE